MASCLIPASRFQDTPWKKDCIERTRILLHDLEDYHLHASVAQRESALLRMYGNHGKSQETLERFINTIIFEGRGQHSEGDARWNAQRCELVISHVQNLILYDHLEIAKRELLAWQPLVPAAPSTMECLMLHSRDTNLGRVINDLGDFNGVLTYFEKLLRDSSQDVNYEHTGYRRVILSSIAELYCELGHADDAVATVESELEFLKARNAENFGSGRRLKLCLAEGYMKQCRFTEAEETLNDLREVLEVVQDPDIITRSGIFRVYYGLARLAHLNLDTKQAIKHWHQTLEAGKQCGWKTAYPMNIVRYSLAHALFESGDVKQSSEQLQLATTSLDHEEAKYWIVGLSTYWYRYVKGLFRMSESTLINTKPSLSFFNEHTKR